MKTRIAGILCAGILLAGCGRKAEDTLAEKVAEAATGAQVDIQHNGDNVTVKTAEGEYSSSTGESLTKPPDFPEDAYCCDGSIKTAVKVPNGHQLSIESTTPSDKLVADARTFMTDKGWSETMFLSQGGTTTLGFTKEDDARTYVLNATAGEGKTAVTITVVNE